jgi:hypothetical protein
VAAMMPTTTPFFRISKFTYSKGILLVYGSILSKKSIRSSCNSLGFAHQVITVMNESEEIADMLRKSLSEKDDREKAKMA